MAKAYQINKIQWPLYEKLFTLCDVNVFKQECTNVLSNLEIVLIKRPPLNESKEARLKIFTAISQ